MNLTPAFAQSAMAGVNPGIYTEQDFAAIARLVHDEAGIVLPVGKAMLVYSRIAPLVRESTSTSFADYIVQLENDAAERKRAIDALTTNHTFFYREAHHFEHLRDTARPPLVSRLRSGGAVRIWSAGCSSGEETWSLVTTLLGADAAVGRELVRQDLRVLATDLSAHVLARAEKGQYSAAEVAELPAPLRSNWLKTEGEQVSIGNEARSIVRFRELNLMGEWPMRQPFDAIFCRNVMIYFDQPTKERLVARFAERIRPGGYLYIGHSERVSGRAAAVFEPVGPTIYRRRPA